MTMARKFREFQNLVDQVNEVADTYLPDMTQTVGQFIDRHDFERVTFIEIACRQTVREGPIPRGDHHPCGLLPTTDKD
jgi:hypothetical protein